MQYPKCMNKDLGCLFNKNALCSSPVTHFGQMGRAEGRWQSAIHAQRLLECKQLNTGTPRVRESNKLQETMARWDLRSRYLPSLGHKTHPQGVGGMEWSRCSNRSWSENRLWGSTVSCAMAKEVHLMAALLHGLSMKYSAFDGNLKINKLAQAQCLLIPFNVTWYRATLRTSLTNVLKT